MDFHVEIKRGHAYAIIAILTMLTSLVAVNAFGTNNPPVMGHSSGEVEISIGGFIKTLQQAIDDGDFGPGGGTGSSGDRFMMFSPVLLASSSTATLNTYNLKSLTIYTNPNTAKFAILRVQQTISSPASPAPACNQIRIDFGVPPTNTLSSRTQLANSVPQGALPWQETNFDQIIVPLDPFQQFSFNPQYPAGLPCTFGIYLEGYVY